MEPEEYARLLAILRLMPLARSQEDADWLDWEWEVAKARAAEKVDAPCTDVLEASTVSLSSTPPGAILPPPADHPLGGEDHDSRTTHRRSLILQRVTGWRRWGRARITPRWTIQGEGGADPAERTQGRAASPGTVNRLGSEGGVQPFAVEDT